jgi:hypothetical protein
MSSGRWPALSGLSYLASGPPRRRGSQWRGWRSCLRALVDGMECEGRFGRVDEREEEAARNREGYYHRGTGEDVDCSIF